MLTKVERHLVSKSAMLVLRPFSVTDLLPFSVVLESSVPESFAPTVVFDALELVSLVVEEVLLEFSDVPSSYVTLVA